MTHVLSHEIRPERHVVGVNRLDPNGIFMYFDLALSTHCGFFRASVRLVRFVGYPQLTRWSVDELVVLFTLQTGVPACYGLRRTSSWCDMMDVCGSQNVTDMLLVRTLYVYDKRPWNMSAITSGADKDNDMEKGTPPVAVSRWYTRVQTYTSICIYFVLL